MRLRLAALALAAAATVVPPTAHADTRATCSLGFDIRFDSLGRFRTLPDGGRGTCFGRIADVQLDPTGMTARIRGAARRVAGACAPRFVQGGLRLKLRQLPSFDTDPALAVSGTWTGSLAPAVGTFLLRGWAAGQRIRMFGPFRFEPNGTCDRQGLAPGRLVVDVLVEDDER